MTKYNLNTLIMAIVGLAVIISGCTGGQDVTSVVKALPEVQQFMNEHPNAKLTVTYWSKDDVTNSSQEISQQCDKPITPIAMYKATISEGDLKVVSWINAENQIVICSTTQGGGSTPKITSTPSVIASDAESNPHIISDKNNSYLAGIKFHRAAAGLEEGFQIAKQENKPIMVYFWAIWGQYDARFQNDTLGNPEIKKFLEQDYVLVAIDLDIDREVAQQYGVSYPPYLVFMDTKGNILERVPGAVEPDYLLPIVTQIREKVQGKATPTLTATPTQSIGALKPILVLRVSTNLTDKGTPMLKNVIFEQSTVASSYMGADTPPDFPEIEVNARINKLDSTPATFWASVPYKGENTYVLTLFFKDGSEPKKGDLLIMPIRIMNNNGSIDYKTTAFYMWD